MLMSSMLPFLILDWFPHFVVDIHVDVGHVFTCFFLYLSITLLPAVI